MDLQRRVDWVLKHRQTLAPKRRKWNLGSWSERAGLRRTHLDTILKRVAAGSEARQEVQTMLKLAQAANVSVCWFTFGVGSPEEKAVDTPSALEAAESMAKAMRYPTAFLADWTPPADDFDADTLWTMIKADYQRWRVSLGGSRVRQPTLA